jgi:ankyrin repeat protein
MDSLFSKKTPGDIKNALKGMSRGTKGLETLYHQAMERINRQDDDSQELAQKVLSWVTHARRPLRIRELQHALAVQNCTTGLDEDFLPEVEDLLSVCAGLVTTDEQSGIVRWIHYTTQEYFERQCCLWFPQAQLDIAKICTTYISFDAFAAGSCKNRAELKERLLQHALYDYAAQNWGHHVSASNASEEFEQWMLNFAESESKMVACYQAAFHNESNFSDDTQMITGVHFGAFFGLSELTALLIRKGYDPDLHDSHIPTPLSCAAGNGQGEVVQLLIATDRVNLNANNTHERTSLEYASFGGHTATVELLLSAGADVNAQEGYHCTALEAALSEGHAGIVELLLGAGANVNAQGGYYGSSLNRAAFEGRTELLSLLLADEKADRDSRDGQGRSALHLAARGGHISTVDSLIALGLNINAKDKRGDLAISYAASGASISVVESILQHQNFHIEEDDGWSPLHWACRIGGPRLLRMLTDKGYQGRLVRTSEPQALWTPYSIAMFHGNRKLISRSGGSYNDTFMFESTLRKAAQGFSEDISSRVGERVGGIFCDGCEHVSLQ